MNPMEMACLAVLVGVVFLNGATDAANAIATAVASGALTMRQGAWLSACMNFAGGVCGGIFLPQIAERVGDSADFGAFPLVGTLASLLAVALFALFAWLFHVPTSESHALLAAVAGASLVLGGRGDALRLLLPSVWFMTLSLGGGFLGGTVSAVCLPEWMAPRWQRRAQILLAAGAAFLHGVQDLAKLMALGYAAGLPRSGVSLVGGAVVLAVGTLLGGRHMTEALGEALATLTPRGALGSEIGAAGATALASLLGLPVSGTHVKTAAIAGSALRCRGCVLHGRQMCRFAVAWGLTFLLPILLGAALAWVLL